MLLTKTIDLSRLDDGEGIEATLQQHKAKWHNYCRLQYNKTKLQHAEKRKRPVEDATDAPKKFTRQSFGETSTTIEACFFSGKPGGSLCRASTFGVDIRVRQCAHKLQDKILLPKLSAGDLIAQDAQYHVQCLISLYNRARETKTSEKSDADTLNHGIAFA